MRLSGELLWIEKKNSERTELWIIQQTRVREIAVRYQNMNKKSEKNKKEGGISWKSRKESGLSRSRVK